MDVHEAIIGRRTIPRFLPEPIPEEQLVRLLSYGTWAPNHHLTEPWSFVILGEETQDLLAERFGELQAERAAEESPERRERFRMDAYAKLSSVPTVVAIVTAQEGDGQRRIEDYAATCCAAQNIQLAAWAEGVGTKWSTSAVTRDPLAYELLDLDPESSLIIGFLFFGLPADIPTRPRRKTLDDVIRWTS